MKRITLFSLVWVVLGFVGIQAQEAQEGAYPFNKRIANSANGLIITVVGQPDMVREAIEQQFLKATDQKPKSLKKDMLLFEAVVYPEISDATLNYYVMLEQPNKKEGRTQVSLFLSPGNDNFWSSDKYPAEIARAKAVLENLDQAIAMVELQQGMETQAEQIKQAMKRLEELKKDKEDLQKEQEKLKKALEENQAKQEKNAVDLSTQMQKLEQENEKLRLIQQTLQTLQNG